MVVPNEEPKKPTKPKRPARPRKSRERSLPVPVPASAAVLQVINPDAAGIDVHSDMHMVCVPADRDANPVRQFGANTADLQEIVAWLKQCRVRTIALESTGVYWIALFELLEAEGFEVYLVEPGQLSRCGVRPRRTCSTRSESNGCTPTVSCGRRFGLPIPCWAGAYWRQRQMQVRYAASHAQHMQKALEQINVKLTEVVSDITGVTGMSIIGASWRANAIRSNWPNYGISAVNPARIRLPWRCKARGARHLFELRQAYELYQFHHRQITECDQQIEAELANFPNRAGAKTHTVKPRSAAQEQRRPVRGDGPVVPGVGCGPDLDRRDRRGNRPGDSG